ncbi:hypothetical protein JL721_7998 [Aureococcus anophagefferens]|nr:hypothetical protein JL721_7998 [Aureococcus anophagefferens]
MTMTTEDLHGMLSVFGPIKLRDGAFAIGYTERSVATMLLRESRAFVEEQHVDGKPVSNTDMFRHTSRATLAAEKAAAARRLAREAAWRARWADAKPADVELELCDGDAALDDEPGHATRVRGARRALASARALGEPARRAALGDYAKKLRDDVASTAKLLYRAHRDGAPGDAYRVGRITVEDLALDMDGHGMRLKAPFVVRAFVGSRLHLETKLCTSLLGELLNDSISQVKDRAASIRLHVKSQERAVLDRVQGQRRSTMSLCGCGGAGAVEDAVADDDGDRAATPPQ